SNGLLRRFLQGVRQRLLRPFLFGLGRKATVRQEVSDGCFGEGLPAGLGAVGHELPHNFRAEGRRCSVVDARAWSKALPRNLDNTSVTPVTDRPSERVPLSFHEHEPIRL